MGRLLIGEVAARAGTTPPTIRYYETLGLLERPARSAAGYRRYSESTVDELRFIRKAQSLGFSLEEIREILRLSREGKAPCAHVLDVAKRHLAAVEQRIRELEAFRGQLSGEIRKWDGARQPACQGLCQIIAGAGDGVPASFQPARPAGRDTQPKGRR